MRVTLMDSQIEECMEHGFTRAMRYMDQFMERYERRPDNPGDWKKLNGNFFQFVALQAEAIASEMVVGLALGLDFGDLGDQRNKDKADVGYNFEVKWTRWADGHLIIAPQDRDTDIAILVTGSCPTYEIKGWMPVKMAKQAKYKASHDSSFWVSQINLRPFETLRRSTHGADLSQVPQM